MQVNILAVGDVCGRPGLDILSARLRTIKRQYDIGFCVVNGENANGVGLTPRQADAIFDAGADVITLGNHTWGRYEIKPYLDEHREILRPENYAPQCPGRGWEIYDTRFGPICVMNLVGRFAMDANVDNPFRAADSVLEQLSDRVRIVLTDMHAEGTSERVAMGWYLDGRASAVWGTHTHVQTSDASVLPGGTGYISDLGMTGAVESVIGIRIEQSINRFLGFPPKRYEPAEGEAKLEGAVFAVDTETGRCAAAEAIRIL